MAETSDFFGPSPHSAPESMTGARPQGFQKGGPKPPGSGRKAGVRNKRTAEIAEAMQKLTPRVLRKLKQQIDDEDPVIAQAAMRIALAYGYGRPMERREISGADGASLAPQITVDGNLTIQAAARNILGLIAVAKPGALPQQREPQP